MTKISLPLVPYVGLVHFWVNNVLVLYAYYDIGLKVTIGLKAYTF